MKASHKAILWIAIPIITIAFFIWLDAKSFALVFLALLVLAVVGMALYMIYKVVLSKIEDIEYEKMRQRDRKEADERRDREIAERKKRDAEGPHPQPFGSGSYYTVSEVKATFRTTKKTTDSF